VTKEYLTDIATNTQTTIKLLASHSVGNVNVNKADEATLDNHDMAHGKIRISAKACDSTDGDCFIMIVRLEEDLPVDDYPTNKLLQVFGPAACSW
jgi:hypothetical protein